MKKIITLIAVFFIQMIAMAQVKELNEKYLLRTRQLSGGVRTLQIDELVNSKLYWEIKEQVSNGIRPSTEDINKGVQTKKFIPKEEGKYFLNNNEQKFWFTIDKNGLYVDSAFFEDNETMQPFYWTFHFENGNITKVIVQHDRNESPIRMIVANDSLFTTTSFNPKTGNMLKKQIIKNGGDWSNSVVIEYYESGVVKREEDRINKIEKSYYENGKLSYYHNSNENVEERISYNEKGEKTEHRYLATNKEYCEESYKNGIITEKECRSSGSITKTYYKNGKLDSYEIESNGELKIYDRNKKLIKTEKMYYPQAAPNSGKK